MRWHGTVRTSLVYAVRNSTFSMLQNILFSMFRRFFVILYCHFCMNGFAYINLLRKKKPEKPEKVNNLWKWRQLNEVWRGTQVQWKKQTRRVVSKSTQQSTFRGSQLLLVLLGNIFNQFCVRWVYRFLGHSYKDLSTFQSPAHAHIYDFLPRPR